MYLVDSNGRIAFKSKPGPFGFKPDELRAAIVHLLGDFQTTAALARSSQ